MAKSSKPRVLIVDDDPDSQRSRVSDLRRLMDVHVLHPEDLVEDDLKNTQLLLVDYRLDRWTERDSLNSIALKPLNGLALAGILREQADKVSKSPTAIAILSGHLKDLSGHLSPGPREHSIARAHNLEWVFPKSKAGGRDSLHQQIASLSSSVMQLPTSWPTDDRDTTRNQARKLLAIPENSIWAERSWEDIEDSHPPFYELSDWSHGLAILRWLLHRILPYPCFLLDSIRLAARLRITHKSLLEELNKKNRLTRALEPVRYKGILSDFLGPRWWRSGVEAILWQLTGGNSFNADAVRLCLSTRGRIPLRSIVMDQPVVCIDDNFKPLEEFVSAESAVRLQPDDWPPYADQAWTTIELAREEPALRAPNKTSNWCKMEAWLNLS